ncbi:transporter substrate-binding domain-containing protein [Aeromonas sobria]|nr:transporter substrate-binding domain-containing protein [Aeromonas sobria]
MYKSHRKYVSEIYKIRWSIMLMLWLFTSTPSLAVPQVETWHLSPSSYAQSIQAKNITPFPLARPLRIGVFADASSPYSFLIKPEYNWEGITADMVSIITKALGINTDIVTFSSRQQAMIALARGEIDVLGEESHVTPLIAPLVTSEPYIICTPLLVGERNEFRPKSEPLSGRVALIKHTIDAQAIRAANPLAMPVEYESADEAFRALLNHDVEWLLGDMVTVMYYLKLADYAEFSPILPHDMGNISYRFVFSPRMKELSLAFDKAIATLTSYQSLGLLRYWGWSEIEQPSTPALTAQEGEWIRIKRPVIKLLVNETFPPYSYLDPQGSFQGIAADIISEIGSRTGLRFEIIPGSALSEFREAFQNNRGDMVTTGTPTSKFQSEVIYSRPYITGKATLVGPVGHRLRFNQLSGRRLVVASTALRDILRVRYPEINLLEAENSLQAFTMVMEGKADAAASYVLTSNYLISHYFSGDLERTDILSSFTGDISFVINKEYPQAKLLQSIINKGIVDLGVNYGAMLSQQWRESEADEKSVWVEHVQRSNNIIIFASAILLSLLVWIVQLYRQRLHRKTELDYWRFRGELFDGIPQPIAVRDLEGRFVQCNQTFYAQCKLPQESVIGVRTASFSHIPPDYALQSEEHYLRLLGTGKSEIRDISIKLDGNMHYFREWSVPYTRSNKLAGLITGWIDLTAVENMAQELQDAHDQALQASKAKSQFLAVMSHEIRTPLNAIIGALEISLKKADRDGKWNRDTIEAAYTASIHLSALIGDILDMAKIEAGRLILNPRPTSINKILNSQLHIFHGLAKQKGLSLNLNNTLLPSECYLIDENAFKQVVSNILGNAIKFTENGGVTLSVFPLSGQEGFRLDISDTGCGIPVDKQSDLFSPFSQVESSSGQEKSGTGLGLAICRQLCSLMGGEINLSSQPNIGTLVSIILPVPVILSEDKCSEEELSSISHSQLPRRLKVLLVDDHSANRWVLAQQLAFLGHETLDAEQGEQAFYIYTTATTPIDAIITDCNMPIMHGHELARRIREWELKNKRPPVPIIGFTANAQEEERAACLNAGMNACLFKPITFDELSTCLVQWCRPFSSERLFDYEQFITLTLGDSNKMVALLEELLKNNKNDLESLSGINSREAEASLIHRIMGGARMLRITKISDACEAYRDGNLSMLITIQNLVTQWQQELQQEYTHLTHRSWLDTELKNDDKSNIH